MDEVTRVILYTLCAGTCITAGAALVNFEKIRPAWLGNSLITGD